MAPTRLSPLVVNETLARRFMPGQSALGRRIRFAPNEPWFTVVGVVKDVVERGYELGSKPGVYVAQAQGPRFFPTVNLIVRVDSDPLGYAAAVQRIVRAVDPDQPIRLIRTMTEVIALTVGDRRQQTTLLVVFGALALVIASLGLYGLLAQTVSARSREIGIRMALGATWRNVMRMVMSRGVVLTGAGLGIGAVLAWSVTRAMETLLYGVGAADPLTFGWSPRCSPPCRPWRARFRRCGRRASIRCWSYATSSGYSRLIKAGLKTRLYEVVKMTLAFLDERCAPVLDDGDRPRARAFGRNREESLTVRHRVHPHDVSGESRERSGRPNAQCRTRREIHTRERPKIAAEQHELPSVARPPCPHRTVRGYLHLPARCRERLDVDLEPAAVFGYVRDPTTVWRHGASVIAHRTAHDSRRWLRA